MIIHFTGMISYMILINTINQYIELWHIKSDNYRKHHVTYFAKDAINVVFVRNKIIKKTYGKQIDHKDRFRKTTCSAIKITCDTAACWCPKGDRQNRGLANWN